MILTLLQLTFTLLLYGVGALVVGLSMLPGLHLLYWVWLHTANLSLHARLLAVALGLGISFFIFGLSLMFLVSLIRIVFRLNLREGEYHVLSWGCVRWALANALQLVVSAVFMDFILLTPFANLFFRMMGARVGRNAQINSKFCADLSLLELGDDAVIGGHATVICHSFERHRLILKKVRIARKAIIGLNAVVLPGCDIGEGALIAAGAVLGKGTVVPPHSVYSGVPAESAKERHQKEA
jgi:acetyltransferase-like isoleucine patch superfamily enzyme